jgi:hypothetical protein
MQFVNQDSNENIAFEMIKSVPVLQRKDIKELASSLPASHSNPNDLHEPTLERL